MKPQSAGAAVSSTAAAIGLVFPSGLPEINTPAMFGLLLALGVLGGLVAARARWRPSRYRPRSRC